MTDEMETWLANPLTGAYQRELERQVEGARDNLELRAASSVDPEIRAAAERLKVLRAVLAAVPTLGKPKRGKK
jgi:hypothetical protein